QIAQANAGMWRVRAEELEGEKASLEEAGNETSGQFQTAQANAGMWRVRAEELETETASIKASAEDASARLQIAAADAGMWRTRAEELESQNVSLEQSGSDAGARLQIAIADAAMWRTRAEELEADKILLEANGSQASAQLQVATADAAMWRTKAEEPVEAPAELVQAARELSGLTLKYDALRSELNNVTEDRARLGHELAEARHAHNSDVEEVRVLVPALKAQLDAASKRMAVLQADLDDDDEERDGLKAQIEKLRAQLSAQPASAAVAFAAVAAGGAGVAASATADPAIASAPVVEPSTAKTPRVALAAFSVDGAKTYTTSCPQHLSDVKGIGTVWEGRLYAAGIGTYWELAQITKDELLKILQPSGLQMKRFDHAAIAADALRLAGETESKGRAWDSQQPDDFGPIDGLGFTYEKRLYDAGVCTYAALIEASDARLEEICRPGKIRKPDFASWRAQARQLMAKK
ncbi:MAG TPA: hypothetical protein PLL45_16585, partial [Thermoflexales bacterium]|nr:hypothetical protein [Thermoflexales bacterium]